MKTMLSANFSARLKHRVGRLSWPGIAGLALLLVAVGVAATNHFVVQPHNESTQSDVGRLSEQLAQARSRPAPAPVLDPEQALLSSLPGPDSIAEFVEFIHDEATRHNLTVDSADYRAETPLAGKAIRYRVSLPVNGSYTQLRAWIDQVLAQKTSASLDEVAIKRESDGAGVLNGRVQLSYFTRAVR